MVTVLVTGGTGLVGSAIRELDNSFIFVNSSINLISFDACDKLFKQVTPTHVIHLAACVGGLYKNMTQKVQMIEDNILINTNVLKCAKKYNVEKLIACLSTCIFPDGLVGKINESMLHDGPPHPSNEGYSYAKRLLECQCRAYNEQYKTNFMCIIPTNIYGPNDNFNLQDSHVIPALIHNCYLANLNNKPFIVKGTGNPLRQFIYSKDLAKLILLILHDDTTNNSILSPSEEYTIRDVAELIAKEFNVTNIKYDTSFSDGQYRKTVDNSKMIKFEFTPINIGISETINWFNTNYETCRK